MQINAHYKCILHHKPTHTHIAKYTRTTLQTSQTQITQPNKNDAHLDTIRKDAIPRLHQILDGSHHIHGCSLHGREPLHRVEQRASAKVDSHALGVGDAKCREVAQAALDVAEGRAQRVAVAHKVDLARVKVDAAACMCWWCTCLFVFFFFKKKN